MAFFGVKVGKPKSIDVEIRRRQALEKKKAKAEEKRKRKEDKRQRELEHLKKGTEVYSARAKYSRAKYASKHPLAVKKKVKRPRRKKGSLRIF